MSLYILTYMDLHLRGRRCFELVLESHLQKQAFLDLPRHSRDREEGLDGYERREYDRYDSYRHIYTYIGLSIYIHTYIYR